MVYIEEAHTSDVWQLPSNVRDDIIFSTPQSLGERNTVAQACVRKLGIEFPAVVDDFDNTTEVAYTAWPDRLYVIDAEGEVAYKSEAGPYGFEPGGVEDTLQALLGDGDAAPARVGRLSPSFLVVGGAGAGGA